MTQQHMKSSASVKQVLPMSVLTQTPTAQVWRHHTIEWKIDSIAFVITDSCRVNNGGCDKNANCSHDPTTNAVRCVCKTGYTNTGSGSVVVCTGNEFEMCWKLIVATLLITSAIDICQVNNGDCDANAICSRDSKTNQAVCTCKPGYADTGSRSRVVCTRKYRCSLSLRSMNFCVFLHSPLWGKEWWLWCQCHMFIQCYARCCRMHLQNRFHQYGFFRQCYLHRSLILYEILTTLSWSLSMIFQIAAEWKMAVVIRTLIVCVRKQLTLFNASAKLDISMSVLKRKLCVNVSFLLLNIDTYIVWHPLSSSVCVISSQMWSEQWWMS